MARVRGGIRGTGLLSIARPITADESLTDPSFNGDMPRGKEGITRRFGLSHASHGTTNEIVDDLTSNGDMPRGRRGNTRKGGLSYAPEGTGDEIVSDSTVNGNGNETSRENVIVTNPRSRSTITSNGNGNETSRENVIVTNSRSRSTIESSQNMSLTKGGRKQLFVVNVILENSSQCSRVIRKIFRERIDDGAFTCTKKHYVWEPATETQVRTAWESKASECYTDFLRDIRRKMIKPIFISKDTWAGFVAHWDTAEYKEKCETNSQNRRKGDGPSTHTGGSVSYREYAKKLETTLKRPPNPFELFVYTHTKNHDNGTFIDKKTKTINDNMLRLREARGANHAKDESSQMVNESAIYYEAVGGVKKRNVYGLGSQAFAYYPNPANRNSATYMAHEHMENKYLEMERKLTRKIGKQQQILELLCTHLDIHVPSTEGETEDNNEAGTGGKLKIQVLETPRSMKSTKMIITALPGHRET